MSTPIAKPDREPDFIDKRGGYWWFEEGLHISGSTSKWTEYEMHPDLDRMVKKNYRCNVRWHECEDDDLCELRFMPDKVEDIRRKLVTKTIEDAIFGEQDES